MCLTAARMRWRFCERSMGSGIPQSRGALGVYLEIEARPNEPFVTKSLDSSGLHLLRVDAAADNAAAPARATVFASPAGVANLRRKVEAFQDEDTPKGRPKNADLVQNIRAIVEAGLRALWRSPAAKFPADDGATHPWEIWLDRSEADHFIAHTRGLGIRCWFSSEPAPARTKLRHPAA